MTSHGVANGVVVVPVRRLPHGKGMPLPAYQSDGAAGLDLLAAVPARKPLTLAPGARALLPTGLVLELAPGTEAQVRPRSGLALRHGLTVLNSPGTIDSDYRGEVQVLLVNLGDAPVVIQRGDRIAQLVVASVTRARLQVVTLLGETERGAGGFGSTGTDKATVAAASAPTTEASGKPMKKSTKVAPPGGRSKAVAPSRPDEGRRRR